MNSAAKILLPLILFAGVGGAAWFLLSGSGDTALPPTTEPRDPVVPNVDPQAPVVDPAQPNIKPTQPDRQRVVVPTEARTDAPQGVRGRVTLPNGGPAVDVPVYLMQAVTADPLNMFLASKTGQKFPPVAAGRTADDGSFALGVTKPKDTYDLRIASDAYPELQHRSIKVREDDWYDAGELRLEVGLVVQGRVLVEGQGFPIAAAKVYLTPSNNSFQILPTPGRERGIVTETDGSGFFQFTNAPREGLITLGADAQDYAYTERTNLTTRQNEANEFTLELARGMPIAGVVVDGKGKPIAGANIQVTAMSAKLPVNISAKSRGDGGFEFPIVREGPYQLLATAAGYEDTTVKPVIVGPDSIDLKVVMEQRGFVRLRVLSARNTPVKVYSLSLRRYFSNNPSAIGKVAEFRDVRINPGDFEGEYATIRNVPNGDFVFQVTDSDHAKSLSPAFTMAVGGEPPVVEMQLTMGGILRGIVHDDRGAPIAGVTVATDMNGGFAADTGFFEMFRNFLPDKHSTTSVKTDGQGHFVLRKLAFADYMLRVSHPDFCEGVKLEIKLDAEGQDKDVGTITLERGAIVEGICTVSGQAAGQIKVVIGPPEGQKPETDAQGRPRMMFAAQAITDNDGRYRMLKRVPPGSYRIHASRQAGNGDIFGSILAMKNTQRQLLIGPGEDKSTQNFDLPAQ